MKTTAITLSQFVSHNAKYYPNDEAIIFQGLRLSWAEFSCNVNRTASVLLNMGVKPNERVAIILPNCIEVLELYWACAQSGITIVPLSPLLNKNGFLSLLNHSRVSCIFIHHELLNKLITPVEDQIELYGPKKIITIGGKTAENPCIRYEEMVAADVTNTLTSSGSPKEEDIYNIIYSSGTTGLPKGIMHTHYVRALYAILFSSTLGISKRSVILHSGSLVFNGAFGTLLPAFYTAAKYVLMSAFDPGEMIELIQKEKVTHIIVVPSQLISILDHPSFEPEMLFSLEVILSLGAPLPGERKEQIEKLLPGRFRELYGLTEGFYTVLDNNALSSKGDSVGIPPAFTEIKIVCEDGSIAQPNQSGEIYGKSPVCMAGYFHDQELTDAVIQDGWICSGDVGYLDSDGYLYLVDRKKDMIDSGGIKVYPKDIEEIAARHPAISEVAIFGVPDEKWGESAVAAVILRPGKKATEIELKEWINANVDANYQKIKDLVIKDDFPRNVAGKVLKYALRAPYWKNTDDFNK